MDRHDCDDYGDIQYYCHCGATPFNTLLTTVRRFLEEREIWSLDKHRRVEWWSQENLKQRTRLEILTPHVIRVASLTAPQPQATTQLRFARRYGVYLAIGYV